MENPSSTALINSFSAIENSTKDVTEHAEELSSLMATAKRLAKLSEMQGNFRIWPIYMEDEVGFQLYLVDPDAENASIWEKLVRHVSSEFDQVTYTLDLNSGNIWQRHDGDEVGNIVSEDIVEARAKRWLSMNAEPPRADRRHQASPMPGQ